MPAIPAATVRSVNVTSAKDALSGTTMESTVPVMLEVNCISTLTTGPPIEEDAIQKRPGVYAGDAVPSVEKKIEAPNAVDDISSARTQQDRRTRLMCSAAVLGDVPFQREARLLRSQVTLPRESPQVAIPVVRRIAGLGGQRFHGACQRVRLGVVGMDQPLLFPAYCCPWPQ